MAMSAVNRMGNALVRWFRLNQRTHLPWRKTSDPYHIWISELMLQQTRVEQAIPYYNRFLRSFPTVQKLSKAGESRVLKAWEGLGYYRRARYVHEAAGQIVNRHEGKLPREYEKLIELPGFGNYTASAVMSIAFNAPYPALDGNALRVLSRVFRIEDDVAKKNVRDHLANLVSCMMRNHEPREITQSIMELGALVCSSKNPRCTGCPISGNCRAFREMPNPALLPRRSQKKAKPHYRVAAGILIKSNRYLMLQRPPKGLLANFWEFPGGRQIRGLTLEETCRAKFREETGASVRIQKKLCVIKHEFTHLKVTVSFFLVEKNHNGHVSAAGRWIRRSELSRLPVSLVSRRALALLHNG